MLDLLCAELSAEVYKPFDEWSMLRVINTYEVNDTEAVLCTDGTNLYGVWRGTASLQDVVTDIQFSFQTVAHGNVHHGIHQSLHDVWGAMLVDIMLFDPTEDTTVVFTGHSLGGGLATLAAMELLMAGYDNVKLYTYGSPRVGDNMFCDMLDLFMYGDHFRFVNNNDIVPRVPPRALGFNHAGQIRYATHDGEIRGRMEWLEKLIDRIAGRWDDLFDLGTDGMKDHFIQNYIDVIKASYEEQPVSI